VECCTARLRGADSIIEIGPGRGALTAGLLKTGLPVRAIELDDALAASLAERFQDLKITAADARLLDLDAMAAELGDEVWMVVGNLPYNVGTTIVKRVLAYPRRVSAVVVMLQREVALKFCASAQEPGYGPLAAWRAAWWTGEILFSVEPGSFSPPPKVVSAVCAFAPKRVPLLPLERMQGYREFLSRAFSRPRRTIASNLGETPALRKIVKAELEKLGLNPLARPGEISASLFVKLMERLLSF